MRMDTWGTTCEYAPPHGGYARSLVAMCSDGSKYPGTMPVPLGDTNDRFSFQQEGKLMISVRPSCSLLVKLGSFRNSEQSYGQSDSGVCTRGFAPHVQ